MQTSEASSATSEAMRTDARQADPRRIRISVPLADLSTNAWLDAQDNISRSIQVLIRESIERDGVIDVVNRPVEQLPRRGRPPLTLVEQASPNESENHSRSSSGHESAQAAAQPVEPIAAPVKDSPGAELDAASESIKELEPVSEHVEETSVQDSTPQSKVAPSGMHEFLTS